MPVLIKSEDSMFASNENYTTQPNSQTNISLTSPVATTENSLTTTSHMVYVIRGESITLQPPHTWIAYMDDLIASQSFETLILLGCTFVSTLIFLVSMIFILCSCCCSPRRKVKNKRRRRPSRKLPPGIPEPPPIVVRKWKGHVRYLYAVVSLKRQCLLSFSVLLFEKINKAHFQNFVFKVLKI